MYKLCVLIAVILLAGCNNRPALAPVVELKWQPHNYHQSSHVVRRGETLYAIAFRYDQDYRQLAVANHLRPPYSLRVGQILRVSGSPRRSYATQRQFRYAPPARNARQVNSQKRSASYVRPNHQWMPSLRRENWLWPVNGRIAARFAPQQGKKGIDIAGKKGEMVHAAAGGVVAYAGSGLSGYGNLIIIKHDNQILTAYGNNSRNIVKEGQKVKVGQVIAEIGVIDRRYWGVHFEIRKAGKPVDPLNYLHQN